MLLLWHPWVTILLWLQSNYGLMSGATDARLCQNSNDCKNNASYLFIPSKIQQDFNWPQQLAHIKKKKKKSSIKAQISIDAN